MALPFKRMYIPYNAYSRPVWDLLEVRAIVLHYTANANSSADADAHYRYFKNLNGRYASAHYMVDRYKAIQIIPDNEVAYHANDGGYSQISQLRGTSGEYNNGNANLYALGIEMCLENDGSIHADTVKRALRITKHLQEQYNVPNSMVLRHFDITGKNCPAPWVRNPNEYRQFKASLSDVSGYNGTGGYNDGYVAKNGEMGVITVSVSELNVRKSASFDSEVVTVMSQGDTYRAYDKKNGMYKLTTNQWTTANEDYINFTEAVQPEGNKEIGATDVYKVQKGDTLWGIGQKFDLSVQEIKQLNNLSSNTLSIGQEIKVSVPNSRMIVVKASELWYYGSANWSDKVDTVNQGECFTIKRELTVSGSKMYELASGNYITANDDYVRII